MAAVHRPPRRWPLVVAGVLVVLVWLVSSLARFWLDLLWFREVDKTQVFWGVLGVEIGLGLLTGLGTALIVGGNLWVARRIAVPSRPLVVEESGPEQLRRALLPYLRVFRIAVVAALGLLVGLHGASQWRTYMLWRNQLPFGDRDAQFGRDIGFYVFSLPLQRAVFGWLLFTLLVVAEHWLLGGIQPAAKGNRVAPRTCPFGDSAGLHRAAQDMELPAGPAVAGLLAPRGGHRHLLHRRARPTPRAAAAHAGGASVCGAVLPELALA